MDKARPSICVSSRNCPAGIRSFEAFRSSHGTAFSHPRFRDSGVVVRIDLDSDRCAEVKCKMFVPVASKLRKKDRIESSISSGSVRLASRYGTSCLKRVLEDKYLTEWISGSAILKNPSRPPHTKRINNVVHLGVYRETHLDPVLSLDFHWTAI